MTRENIIRKHYGLNRKITKKEIRDEVASLKRKARRGALDDRSETLYIELGLDRRNPVRRKYRKKFKKYSKRRKSVRRKRSRK